MADGLDTLTASAGSGCLCSGPSQDLRKVDEIARSAGLSFFVARGSEDYLREAFLRDMRLIRTCRETLV
jgi:hypothetical protein